MRARVQVRPVTSAAFAGPAPRLAVVCLDCPFVHLEAGSKTQANEAATTHRNAHRQEN